MRAQIVRLFVVVVVLFALLIGWTSRWTVFSQKSLANNQLNKLTFYDDLRIKRGRILAADGSVLARSVAAGGGTWNRSYPTGSLFAQTIGYDIADLGSAAGLERSHGDDLRGRDNGLTSVFGQLSPHPVGNDLVTTLDPAAQKVALQALDGQTGSVVAIDPRTGAIKAMVSLPGYDDNGRRPFAPPAGQTTFNRSTQAAYPPGSTFKVVTATAAIDTGKYTPDSTVNGNSPVTISGTALNNDNDQSFGPTTLTDALTFSVNTVWAQVAVSLGQSTMSKYMERFGFYAKPPIDLPPDELNTSQPHSFSKGNKALSPNSGDEDVGRVAIGQGGLEVTPLQMAMVASAVADNGKLMVPRIGAKVVDQDGRTVKTYNPQMMDQVMKPSTAQAVAQMMKRVVDEGTGTPAQLGNGIEFAGKTGTASVGVAGSGLTQPWFIGFAPLNNPKVAIAVTIERSNGGFGGQVAAPIAKQVVQQLLNEGNGQ
jgi:peptidoglycan glycosyltransferase